MENYTEKFSVVGAGLVGTSLVMATRRQYPDAAIVALDTNRNHPGDSRANERLATKFHDTLQRAGITRDHIVLTFDDVQQVRGSRIVNLTTPGSSFGAAIERVAPYLSVETAITDLGSVKVPAIERTLSAIQRTCPHMLRRYVPAHILNGNAGSGPLAASPRSPEDKTLFEGKPLVIVPDIAEDSAYRIVTDYYRSLGTTIFEMTAEKHDRILGTASHFHYASMFAFILTDEIRTGRGPDLGGWIHGAKGMTRIADTGEDGIEMPRSFLEDNRDNVLIAAKHFKKYLLEAIAVAESGNYQAISDLVIPIHLYAKKVRGDRGGLPLEPRDYQERDDCENSAFASLISMAVALNVQRVECETRKAFAPMANPSAKDGMGPVGIDPVAVTHLLWVYGHELRARTERYLDKLDTLLAAVEKNDNADLSWFIVEAGQTRQAILRQQTSGRKHAVFRGASISHRGHG